MDRGSQIRVYLSSSFSDLKDVRSDIIAYINKQKSVFYLVNMEDYAPESTYPADKCVSDVESCDIYIGVFAWRYGSIEPNSGKSITELELNAAQRKQIEILVFVLDGAAAWSPDQMDLQDLSNINRLRKHVLDSHLGSVFKSKEELCTSVISALNTARDRIQQAAVKGIVHNSSENDSDILKTSYLRWLMDCHERLEFRGIRHARGGAVSVELRQVYLALQADSTNPLERAAARQALLSEVTDAIETGEITADQAEFAVWYVVSGIPIMPSIESRDRINALDPSQKELLNLAEAYYRESRLVILGDPGSGKTTLARWLTLVMAQAAIDGKHDLYVPLYQVDPTVDDMEKTVSLGKTRLPILIRIAEYADERSRCAERGQVPPTLLDFLGRQTWLGKFPIWNEDSPRHGEAIHPELLNQFFKQSIQDGNALVILDGLDEVPASALRDDIVEEVDSFAQQWIGRRMAMSSTMVSENLPTFVVSSVTADSPGNRLIITSRIAGYHLSALQGDLAHVTVEPMSPQAVSQFITNWMHAVHQELAAPTTPREQVIEAASADVKLFLAALAEPRQRGGRELATNPLLCGILATIFKQHRGDLPQERVELYRQAVELLFEIWLRRHGEADEFQLIKFELYDVLEPIAEHVHRHEATGLIPENQLRQLALQFLAESRGENPLRATPKLRRDVDEMIRMVKEDVGLLAARGEGLYGFLHLTFQEYLAARSLARNPANAAPRITEHLGDSRWREVIRLALGHLNIENPTLFATVVKELVSQESSLDDLLPQAALTVVGALPDLRVLDGEVAEILVERLLRAYSNQDLLTRLPKRRELLERALRKVWESENRAVVESYLAQAIEEAATQPELAFASAELSISLECCTPRLFQALARAVACDSVQGNWVIHRALRRAVTPEVGRTASRVEIRYGCLPFRQAVLGDPTLLDVILSDFDWLQVVFMLYGGLGDFDAAAAISEYHRIAGFLQQEDSYRQRYRQAYLDGWGQADGDFVYNMAVFLDTAGGLKLKNANRKSANFEIEHVHRDSTWTTEILALLRQRKSPRELLPQLQRAISDCPDFAKKQEAGLLLRLMGQAQEASSTDEATIVQTARVRADLFDGVTRCGKSLATALPTLMESLPPTSWWGLYEATQTLVMEHGAEPFSPTPLLETASELLHSHLIAECLILHGQGFGDDSVYNAAVFADTIKLTVTQFLAAHAVLPLAVNRRLAFRHSVWPIASLPPIENSLKEVSPHLLTTIEMVPNNVGFIRCWIIRDILKPLIKANPELLPEILACALGDSGERSSRNDLFKAFCPVLLTRQNPAEEIYQQAIFVQDRYHRARALLRLASHWPERKLQLIQEAALLAKEIIDPLRREYIYEWLYTIGGASGADEFLALALGAAGDISSPNNCARAYGRLGVASSASYALNAFERGFAAAEQIENEFDRATTIRLLRRVSAVQVEIDPCYQDAVVSLRDPVQRARAAEDYQAVIRLLTPALRKDLGNQQLWALLSLAAQVEPRRGFSVTESNLWRDLVASPSLDSVNALVATARTSWLELTPLAAGALENLIDQGAYSVVEELYPRLRPASWEITPFLHRQSASPRPKIAALSGLFLVELQGLSPGTVPGLIQCLVSSDDLTSNRAAMQLYSGSNKGEPIYRASLIGREALDLLFRSQDERPQSERNRIRNTLRWFCERLLCDAPDHLASWATTVRNSPEMKYAKRGLESIHLIDDSTWKQVVSECRTGPFHVQEALLFGISHLAKHNRLDGDRWDMLMDTMNQWFVNKQDRDEHGGTCVSLEALSEVLLSSLESNSELETADMMIADLRNRLSELGGFTWKSLFSAGNSADAQRRLQEIGKMSSSTKATEVDRWAHAASVAKSGVQHSGFLERLTTWVTVALSESPTERERFNLERSYLIELLAGAATVAPARYHSSANNSELRPVLLRAAIEHDTYVGRSDAVRLLGYSRYLSLDLLPSLRSALMDVEYVRDGAIEAMGLFRRMDQEVLGELQKWLTDESGIVAFATARLLTAIGRHTQIAGRADRTATGLRRDIIQILAQAVRDPRSYRPLDFGAHSAPTPDIPMICDFFFDCMLKVAGFDEPRDTQPKATSKT